jgi:hypothetical protein
MAFPTSALYARTEIYRDHDEAGVTLGGWVDTTADVYNRDGIAITRGRGDEASDLEPTTIDLTFNNRDGLYSPRNPRSALYGLIGRNTPLRVSVGTDPSQEDAFTRSVSDGWNGANGLTWSLSGGVAADFDVNGTEATQTHPDTNVLRYSTVDSGETDHRVRAVFDLSASDVTGAGASVWLLARMTNTSNYYALVASYSTSEVLTFRLHKRVGGTLTAIGSGSVTVEQSGSGGGGFDFVGEIYVEGDWVHAKVWRRLILDEPLVWGQSVQDTSGPPSTGTLVGLASRRETGNTNGDLQARFHHFLVVPGTLRATAEVSSWPPRWDVSGRDVYTPVQAAGIARRLEQGQRPLRSALWRENLFSDAVAYWPINDGDDAASAASALPDGPAMSITTTAWLTGASVTRDWSPVSYAPWLESIATPAADIRLSAVGQLSMPTAVAWSADFVFVISADADPLNSGATLTTLGTGTATEGDPRIDWVLSYANNAYTLQYIERSPTPTGVTVSSGAVAVYTGAIFHSRLIVADNGADLDWQLLINNSLIDSGTLAASTFQTLTKVATLCGVSGAGFAAVGHVAVWDHASPPGNAANAAVVGRSGETAADRLTRLLSEEGIGFQLIGNAVDTAAMGPQLLDTLLANIRDCEDVDMGALFEPRHFLGLGYRTRVSLYNQTPKVELDYATRGHVAPPLEPVEDDQRSRNDVTVSRPRGSSARFVKDSGPLNTSQPWDDPQGIGVYDEDLSLNVDSDAQLAPIAQWRVHKGTWDEARYRALLVDLRATATLYETVARLDIGDVATVDSAPSWLAAELIELLVEGYAETIGLHEWKLSLNTSPARIYTVGEYDADGSRYDSAYSTTAEAITTGTDTSLDVAVEASRGLWVTGSGSPQFPFDIDLLGSRVTVTAITGAASPQVFTLSATVANGVAKDVPTGTPVRLWNEARYAL